MAIDLAIAGERENPMKPECECKNGIRGAPAAVAGKSGLSGVECSSEGCVRPAHRHDKRFDRPLCRRCLCIAIQAWREANRAAGRCFKCGADKGGEQLRDCAECRSKDAESYRRRRARKAALRDKHRARNERRARAVRDAETDKFLRGARW